MPVIGLTPKQLTRLPTSSVPVDIANYVCMSLGYYCASLQLVLRALSDDLYYVYKDYETEKVIWDFWRQPI